MTRETVRAPARRPGLGALAVLLAMIAAPAAAIAQNAADPEAGAGSGSQVIGSHTATTGGGGSALVTAGANVAVDADTAEDAIVAGGAVRLDGRVGEDLFAAGGRVRVGAEIAEDAFVAGGRVEIAESASIGGWLTAFGGDLTVDGTVAGGARLAGGSIEIAGRIAGDVEAAGGSLTLLPGAEIGGTLSWRGRDAPTIAEGATVRGTVNHRQVDDIEIGIDMPRMPEGAGIAGRAVFALGCLLVGALWLAATPRFLARAGQEIRRRPLVGGLLGLGVLAGWPVGAVVVAVTVIGLPLALILFLLYPVVLFAGWLMAAFALSEAAIDRRTFPAGYGLRLLAFAVALAVLAVAVALPFVGGLIAVVALLLGLGALVRGGVSGRDPLGA